MVRETVIYCDPCREAGARAEAVERALALDGDTEHRLIALCETHEKELISPLEDLLGLHGVPLGQVDPLQAPLLPQPRTGADDESIHANGVLKCNHPGCDKEYDPATHERAAQALGMHKRRAHGIVGTAKKVAAGRS